jgi:hypothetical protein
MPRLWTIVVSAWSRLVEDRPYDVRVIDVRRNAKPDGVLVTLEHLEEPGRRNTVLLRLPCRPDGPTAEFFRACGQEVEPDTRLRPRDCIGQIIAAHFRALPNDEYEAYHFEAMQKDDSDDNTSA